MRLSADCESSVWLQNLVDGLAGFSIKAKHAVHFEASPFQKIEVFDTYAFGRVLLLGGTIVYTECDGHIYNEMMTHPVMNCHKSPLDVCIIGGGDGGCLREVLKHSGVKKVEIVEIDRQVTGTVKKYFPELAESFSNNKVKTNFMDGYEWLKENNRKFDVILVDSYDPGGPVQSLETGNFYDLVKRSLKTGGMASIQTDSPQLYREKIQRTMRDLTSHFAWCRPYIATIPSFPLGTCSFILCGESGDGPRKPDASRVGKVTKLCRYYSASIHDGAFCLPKIVGDVFNV